MGLTMKRLAMCIRYKAYEPAACVDETDSRHHSCRSSADGPSDVWPINDILSGAPGDRKEDVPRGLNELREADRSGAETQLKTRTRSLSAWGRRRRRWRWSLGRSAD